MGNSGQRTTAPTLKRRPKLLSATIGPSTTITMPLPYSIRREKGCQRTMSHAPSQTMITSTPVSSFPPFARCASPITTQVCRPSPTIILLELTLFRIRARSGTGRARSSAILQTNKLRSCTRQTQTTKSISLATTSV